MLENAEDKADNMGDNYVSTEHFLLALLDEASEVSEYFSDFNITTDGVKSAMQEVLRKEMTPVRRRSTRSLKSTVVI